MAPGPAVSRRWRRGLFPRVAGQPGPTRRIGSRHHPLRPQHLPGGPRLLLSVGPGRVLDSGKRLEMEVKGGDMVLFAKYAGTEVKLDGEDYLVIREVDLLAIVTNGKNAKNRKK